MGAPQYIRQTLTDTKGEMDHSTVIVGDFNTPLTPMDRSPKQKINKEAQVLNGTLYEMDLFGIFRTFHPHAEEYTFFSGAHGTFSRLDHILDNNQTPVNLRKLKSYPASFPNHKTMRLNINYKEKNCKKHKNMEVKQYISK